MSEWRHCVALWVLAACGLAAGAAAAGPATGEGAHPGAAATEDSCVKCHSNPDFLVTQPKLYRYFQDWERSIHRQEGVTCSDCHGGDPSGETAERAHHKLAGGTPAYSPVNFANIPETCGSCHPDVADAYLESEHAKHLVAKGSEQQGPSCVTCHGSMNTQTLDVNSVEGMCATCHNEAKGNHPEIPARAVQALNRVLSMNRFYRYLSIRLKADEAKTFLGKADQRMSHVAVVWHSFDLDRVETEMTEVLDLFKRKRDEVRARNKAKPGGEEPATTTPPADRPAGNQQ